MCFQWFLRVGGASKAPKGRLEGPPGGTLGAKVITWTYIFAIIIQVRFLSATWERQMQRSAAVVGPAEGGEASLSELCIAFCLRVQHALLPLAEVRRILRATPTAAGPSSDRHSVFLIGFLRYFSVFWDRFLMISGSNFGGVPPPEHL